MKDPINVESVLKFFEKNNNFRFIDSKTKKSVLAMIVQNKNNEKTDFDLWLENQDKETQLAYKMGEI